MKKDILLFVYGSMKRGFSNSFILENAKYLGDVTTYNRYCIYPSLNFNYPYAVKSDKKWKLKGELYQIRSEDLSIIDDFEEVPKCYFREIIKVVHKNTVLKAFIYFRSENNEDSYDKKHPLREWRKKDEKKRGL